MPSSELQLSVEPPGTIRGAPASSAAGTKGTKVTVQWRGSTSATVRLGERTFHVDGRPIGEGGWSLLIGSGGAGGGGASYVLESSGEAPLLAVAVDGLVHRVRVEDPREALRARATASSGSELSAAAVALTAPMPGKIVKVLVGAGARVNAGQPLVVMEAMKMENELRAPREGQVQTVAVVTGQAVEAGATLLVVK